MEKTSGKTIKKFNSRMQARLLLVFCVITLLLLGLMGRLIYIMQTDGERYAKQVLSRQSKVSKILPYKRGDILDRNGSVMATSELQYRLVLDPLRILLYEDYIIPTQNALKEYFGIDPQEIQSILESRPESQYVILRKNLKFDQVKKFETMMDETKEKIGFVWFEEEYIRTYPYNTLASDIIGFTTADNRGLVGIERYYDEYLNGTNGRIYGYYDSSLNIERIVKSPKNGDTLVTTIDLNIQRIIQKHIKEFNSEFGSKNIGILVMDPNNGEIIAMASNQEYDLNSPRDLSFIPEDELSALTEEQKIEQLNILWKNDVISFGFEPGSTFKPFTIAAALEEGILTENSTFYCDGGEYFGNSRISCHKETGHGELTVGEALIKSCNDILMQIAALEGRDIFFSYENHFGFGHKTGIDLPGEEAGLLIAKDNLNATELATSSFGQSMNVTMIQMAAAYASLVNGGNYYAPHVVKKIVNEKGATIKENNQILIRQTVSEETSEFIKKYMYQTVEVGTARTAKVPGYTIAGKTGTAQKYPREAKTFLVSFLGHVPAINPEVVIFVIVDEPQNVVKQADSTIATKLAARVLNEILPALGVFPDGEIDYLLPEDGDIEAEDEIWETGGFTDTGSSGNDNSTDTDNTGTNNSSDTGSSGNDNSAGTGNSGNDNSASTGNSGNDNSASTSSSGNNNSAGTGNSGNDNSADTGSSGNDNSAGTGNSGNNNSTGTSISGNNNSTGTSISGNNNSTDTGNSGTNNSTSTGGSGTNNSADTDNAGNNNSSATDDNNISINENEEINTPSGTENSETESLRGTED